MNNSGCKVLSYIYGAHGGHETTEVRELRRAGGGRGLSRGAGKGVNEVFPV